MKEKTYFCLNMRKNKYIFLKIVFALSLLCVFLLNACKTYNVDHIDHASIEFTDTMKQDSSLLLIINEYKIYVDSSMNNLIAYSETMMQKGQPESLLGNFVCDLILETALAKFSDSLQLNSNVMVLMNNGGFRSSLPMGGITIGDVYQLMPFDNEIVILKLPGTVMKNVLSSIALKGGMPLAGVELVLRAENWTSASFSGNNFDENNEYFLITSDYIADGGGNIPGLDKYLFYFHSRLKVRDVIIDYFIQMTEESRTADPKLDGRIRYE